MSQITIAAIDVKPKRSIVTTSEGRKLGIWHDKLSKLGLEAGATYDVETTDAEVNGVTLTNIVGAKRCASATSTTTASTAKPATNGYAGNGNGNGYRRTDPVDSERMFTCACLTAFIKAGKVEPELGKVTNAINVLRTAYQRTFGMDDHAE
jgi:hypothetical protein